MTRLPRTVHRCTQSTPRSRRASAQQPALSTLYCAQSSSLSPLAAEPRPSQFLARSNTSQLQTPQLPPRHVSLVRAAAPSIDCASWPSHHGDFPSPLAAIIAPPCAPYDPSTRPLASRGEVTDPRHRGPPTTRNQSKQAPSNSNDAAPLLTPRVPPVFDGLRRAFRGGYAR